MVLMSILTIPIPSYPDGVLSQHVALTLKPCPWTVLKVHTPREPRVDLTLIGQVSTCKVRQLLPDVLNPAVMRVALVAQICWLQVQTFRTVQVEVNTQEVRWHTRHRLQLRRHQIDGVVVIHELPCHVRGPLCNGNLARERERETHTHTHTHTQRKRERERQRDRKTERQRERETGTLCE